MVASSDRYCVSTVWIIDRFDKGKCIGTVYLYHILRPKTFAKVSIENG